MTNPPGRPDATARPSTAYVVTLSLGCAAMAFAGTASGGEILAFRGQDTLGSFNSYGFAAFVLAFCVMFASRLLFRDQIAPSIRSLIRAAICVLFVLSLLVTIVSLYLAWRLPPGTMDPTMPMVFGVLAALCQIGAVSWLASHRSEPVFRPTAQPASGARPRGRP